jgi:hypothetical protein
MALNLLNSDLDIQLRLRMLEQSDLANLNTVRQEVTTNTATLTALIDTKTGDNAAAITTPGQNTAVSITALSEMITDKAVNLDDKIKANTTAISTLSATTDQSIASITNLVTARNLATTADLNSLNTGTTNLETLTNLNTTTISSLNAGKQNSFVVNGEGKALLVCRVLQSIRGVDGITLISNINNFIEIRAIELSSPIINVTLDFTQSINELNASTHLVIQEATLNTILKNNKIKPLTGAGAL